MLKLIIKVLKLILNLFDSFSEARREPIRKPVEPAVLEKPAIPDDLLCGVCKDLLADAVLIPCCGNSFCDECMYINLIFLIKFWEFVLSNLIIYLSLRHLLNNLSNANNLVNVISLCIFNFKNTYKIKSLDSCHMNCLCS